MDKAISNIFDKEQNRVFIVAEIGSSHNQDLDYAYQTIDAAVTAGADAVKFQSLNMDELYFDPNNEIRDLHERIDLEENWHYKLKNYCDQKQVIFFSSPTYLKAVKILEDIDVKLYKLASAQVGTFPQLIEQVASTGKPVLLSTGLATYSDLDETVQIFRRNQNNKFVILHCNSIYPTPYGKVNLKLINVYRAMFANPVGFSDHARNIYMSLAAVSIGAAVIEKHFTLDKNIPSPDSSVCLDPHEFKSMVNGIRAIEHSMCFKERILIEEEEASLKNAFQYRLILNRDKKRGDFFSSSDFDFKRHNDGIDCRELELVIKHMTAQKDINKGSLLTWDKLTGFRI